MLIKRDNSMNSSFLSGTLLQYLNKQSTTLREVNDSRVKIYEQLEVSIAELETTNKKLIEENMTDKVKIRRYVFLIASETPIWMRIVNLFFFSLCENIEKLENRCEELQRLLDESRGLLEKQQQLQKRRRERSRKSSSSQRQTATTKSEDDEEEEETSGKNYNSSASDTESERTSSTASASHDTRESGYSSGSMQLTLDSDSELSSSPDREQPKSLEVIEASVEVLTAQVDAVKEDKMEIQERLCEMEKVVNHLQAENKRLQVLLSAQDCMQDSFRSVDDEVQDIHDVRYVVQKKQTIDR